jgi:arginine utilization protein RocB
MDPRARFAPADRHGAPAGDGPGGGPGDGESLYEATARWALALTAVPSVSRTEDEAALPARLVGMLRARPAFAGRPEDVFELPVPDGLPGLACVGALFRGEGPRTVVLTGHFDTVHVEDYGDLKPLALDAVALKAALVERLRRDASTERERRALADLEGPDFLPGRGLLDMKGGLAAGLAVAERFAARPGRRGNLLFLAVPDEEVNSAGARAAAAALPAVAERFGLSIEAAVNLDAIADDGDGREGRAVALGTVGKLLPSALVVGRAVHAAFAHRGFGACAIAGALAAEVEWAPELAERTGGDEAGFEPEFAPGPTLLGMKDGKRGYDVTTPERVWMYWNASVHRRGPAAVMDAMGRLAARAAAALAEGLDARRRAVFGEGAGPLPPVPVLRFEDLRREAEARSPDAAAALAAAAREAAAAGLDLPEQCRIVTERAWDLSGRAGPAVVLGFASMPYLPASLGEDEASARLARAAAEAAAETGAAHGAPVRLVRFFPGISDMSFLGQADEAAIRVVADNTPAWGAGIPWPAGRALGGIPIVNAGPWGRDYHTPLERIHTPYGFGVLPELIAGIVDRVLGVPTGGAPAGGAG